jgi:hypothetical protein
MVSQIEQLVNVVGANLCEAKRGSMVGGLYLPSLRHRLDFVRAAYVEEPPLL